MHKNPFSDLPLPVAVVGLGISGTSVYEMLRLGGIPASSIMTFDEKAPAAQFRSTDDLINQGKPSTLVVSPGVPLASQWIVDAKTKGVKVTSELSLASQFLTSEQIIAITGSVGKSTTTSILEAALQAFSPSYFVGGNLGIPLAKYVIDLFKGHRRKADWVVLELSSYQLENFPELKADISIITYLTSNHLERYPDKETYFQTKWNIENHTTHRLILNKNGGELLDWSRSKKEQLPRIWTSREAGVVQRYGLNDCQLIGSHNLDNMAMAGEVAELAGWPKSSFEGMKRFRGLPHRVENLGTREGVRYINDSKATTMESVRIAVGSAVESLPPQNLLHILMGGRDKNLPWNELNSLKNSSNLRFYFFGECRSIAHQKSGLDGNEFPTLKDAFGSASTCATSGDSILLSPGGTSLDEFKNFEHRGDFFRDLVNAKR